MKHTGGYKLLRFTCELDTAGILREYCSITAILYCVLYCVLCKNLEIFATHFGRKFDFWRLSKIPFLSSTTSFAPAYNRIFSGRGV
jgi:hypothetical protein